jgi:hypothetical protein
MSCSVPDVLSPLVLATQPKLLSLNLTNNLIQVNISKAAFSRAEVSQGIYYFRLFFTIISPSSVI